VKPYRMLSIEDNPGDVRLLRELFTDDSSVTLTVAHDGVAALQHLHGMTTTRPDLILLDLNLPRKDGFEVLGELKTDDTLKSIPVVVLTSSRAEVDIQRAYQLHANAYIVKPLEFDGWEVLVQGIRVFWLTCVTLPGQP
jgi:two-component system, chemotaxis family, response regulator Rcp1